MEAKELRLLPFDLEKAKAGAKVVTKDGKSVRIVCWDYKGWAKEFGYPLLGLIDCGEEEISIRYSNDGKRVIGATSNSDLFFLDETPQFQPFDKVLVYDKSCGTIWVPMFYRDACNCTGKLRWRRCIPYEGNEHLAYTNKNLE